MATFPAIRNRVIDDLKIGMTLLAAEIDSGSGAAVVSTKRFRNPNWSTNYFRSLNAGLHRPDVTSAEGDKWRLAGDLTVSTGSLAPDAAWATDTTWTNETLNIIYYGIHYQDIDDAINRALEDVLFQNEVALSIFSDGDMQASNTTSWTGASGATLSKVTTAVRTPFGIRSLRVQNDSADDYAQSVTVKVRQGDKVYVWAIASVDAGGSAELVLYDITNSANIGTLPSSAESDEESPTYLWRREAVPATCKEFAVRLNGEGATSDIFWNQLGGYRMNDRRIFLPSTFDERFKVEAMTYAEFVSNDALSIETHEIPRSDYSFLYANPQANPYAVQFHSNKWMGKPLLIQGRRPYSDMGTLSAETDTTTCPLNLIASAAAVRLLTPSSVRSKVKDGDELLAIAYAQLQKQAAPRHVDGPANKHSYSSWGRV